MTDIVGGSLRERLADRIREAPHCDVMAEPVRFGHRGWLAQHRWLEPAIGLVLLLPVGWLYLLTASSVSHAIDVLLAVAWVGFVATGLAMRQLRPCAVMRFPAYALGTWLALVLIAAR